MGVMESRADRPGGNAEGVGDLDQGVPGVVMEHQHRPLVRGEAPEPSFELVSVTEHPELIGCRWSVDRERPQVDRPLSLTRGVRDADVREDLANPRVEPVRIAKAPQVAPGDHQCVLQGILGPVDIAEDPERDREQPIAAGMDQVHEGRLVAPLCRTDEIPVPAHLRPNC